LLAVEAVFAAVGNFSMAASMRGEMLCRRVSTPEGGDLLLTFPRRACSTPE